MGAYRYWGKVWKSSDSQNVWTMSDDWVLETAAEARRRNAVSVLDLGCGVGRHALDFARMGFATSGFDRSSHALAAVRSAATEEELEIDLREGDITQLPYGNETFDYALAYNVVYHGDEAALARTLAEVHRIIRSGGWYQATMLSKRNAEYGRGIEINSNTFVQPDADDDKIYEHLYCDFRDLARLHKGFELISAFDAEHEEPGSFHWHALFEVRSAGAAV